MNIRLTEVKLDDQINELRVSLVSFGDKLMAVGNKFDNVNKSVTNLSAQMVDMQKALEAAGKPPPLDEEKIKQIVNQAGKEVIFISPYMAPKK